MKLNFRFAEKRRKVGDIHLYQANYSKKNLKSVRGLLQAAGCADGKVSSIDICLVKHDENPKEIYAIIPVKN